MLASAGGASATRRRGVRGARGGAWRGAGERTRRRQRRRVRSRHLRPRPDTPAPTRYAVAPPAPRKSRAAQRLPRERQSTPPTAPHRAIDAACLKRNKNSICARRPTSPGLNFASRNGSGQERQKIYAATGTPALDTEKTPEASLSREGSHGSIDSPGRLTRRASRDAQSHSCGAAPASHRLPQANPNADYAPQA